MQDFLFVLLSPRRARRLAALTAVLGAAIFSAQAQSFGPAVVYIAGANSTPQNLATGDVNGDTRLDIVTANFGSNTVGVLLGQSGGSFGTVTTYPTGVGSTPQGVALGDVNGDGRPDIFTANTGTNTVGVLLSVAGGGFAPVFPYISGPSSALIGVALGDVNGDTRLDIVTANSGSNTVGVLLGLGGGLFGTVVTYPTGATGINPYGVALGDVNSDNRLDIVTANATSNTVGVLLGQAGGLFAPVAVVTYPTGSGTVPQAVALGDVNGDKLLDIVTANNGANSAGVLLGLATGGFGPAMTYSTGLSSAPNNLALGDVNGDKLLDIVTANSSSTVGVLLGVPGGGFGAVTTYDAGPGSAPNGVVLNDVNGDKLLDALTANNGSSTAGVLLGVSVPAPTLTSISPVSGPVGTVITLTGTNLTGATGVSFNGTVATTIAVVNATTVTATVPTGATTGNVTITTPGGTSNGLVFTLVTDLVVSTGTPTSPTLIAGNYNNVTITSTGNAILIDQLTVAGTLTIQPGGGLNQACQLLIGPGNFDLQAGGTLAICDAAGISPTGVPTGAVLLTGTRTYSPLAQYIYSGNAAQVTGLGLPSTVLALGVQNAAGVTLSQALSLTQGVNLNSGNLNTGGQTFTLLSSASGTAGVVNTGGAVVGTATVQRYIDPTNNAGPGYRHYSAPVSNTTVADLATAGFAPTLTTSYNASATPGTTTPFPTVFGYDQRRVSLANSSAPFDRGFVVPDALTTPLAVGQGYAVNIAGNQLVDFVGTLTTGDQSPVALSRVAANPDAGWQLVGNPYPAPLDYARVAPTDRPNLDAAIYVYSSTGLYVGTYRAYLPPADGGSAIGNGVLPVAQGFFVRVSAGQPSGSLTFRNAQRLTSPQATTFQRGTADTRPLVQLELRGATGPADTFYAYATIGATPAFDSQLDAVKLPNTMGLNLASRAEGAPEGLAIDARPAFTAATVLPLTVGVPAAGAYTLSAAALTNLPAGLDAYLHDAVTGQIINLRQQPRYAFAVSPAQTQAGLSTRFSLGFSPQAILATHAGLHAGEVSLFPNPARDSFTVLVPVVTGTSQLRAELLNALGQVVRRLSAALPADGASLHVDTAGLAGGVYILRLSAGPTTLTKRVVLQ